MSFVRTFVLIIMEKINVSTTDFIYFVLIGLFSLSIDTIHNSPVGRFNGIGFVFKEIGGLTGIDLDKCAESDTGARLYEV